MKKNSHVDESLDSNSRISNTDKQVSFKEDRMGGNSIIMRQSR